MKKDEKDVEELIRIAGQVRGYDDELKRQFHKVSARVLRRLWVRFDADGDTYDELPTFDW